MSSSSQNVAGHIIFSVLFVIFMLNMSNNEASTCTNNPSRFQLLLVSSQQFFLLLAMYDVSE